MMSAISSARTIRQIRRENVFLLFDCGNKKKIFARMKSKRQYRQRQKSAANFISPKLNWKQHLQFHTKIGRI
jgi:hypothetical protein